MALTFELKNKKQVTVENSTVLPVVRYKAYLFGPFRVLKDGHLLEKPIWRRNKAQTLLKWFLLNPGKFFSIDRLSKLCWPDIDQAVAARNLHVTIHYLRHLLEPDLEVGQKSTFIRRNKHNFYWFDLNENWWIDLVAAEQLLAGAQEAEFNGDVMSAIACYHELINYYAQGFLPEEIYEDMFSSYRRQYDCAHVQIFDKLMRLCAQANMLDDLLTYGFQALSLDPYCEAAITAIVRVHLKRGNVASALRMLDTFQDRLKQDLRITPNEELCALRNMILHGS